MIYDINNLVLIGRITKNSCLEKISNGDSICKIHFAVNHPTKADPNQVSFFMTTIWGDLAKSIYQYLKKGKQIGVIGELRQKRWESNGNQLSRIEIKANRIQLLGKKDKQEDYSVRDKDTSEFQHEEEMGLY